VSYNRSSEFYFKYLQNSGIMVEQRARDIVLDLIVLSFKCSRPKRRLRSSMVKGNMGKFKVILEFRGEFLFECMCTF
jgi:hypothetical protein